MGDLDVTTISPTVLASKNAKDVEELTQRPEDFDLPTVEALRFTRIIRGVRLSCLLERRVRMPSGLWSPAASICSKNPIRIGQNALCKLLKPEPRIPGDDAPKKASRALAENSPCHFSRSVLLDQEILACKWDRRGADVRNGRAESLLT